MKWVGQLLRAPEEHLPRRVLIGEWVEEGVRCGGLLHGAPRMDIIGLIALARDVETWEELVSEIRNKL